MTEYTALIGKTVRVASTSATSPVAGRLESWEPIEGSDCATAWIRRRSGTRDVMRFHRTDLWMASPAGQAALSAAIERLEARQQ